MRKTTYRLLGFAKRHMIAITMGRPIVMAISLQATTVPAE
jgi:hypothetical protein